jgi:hypothetical protein
MKTPCLFLAALLAIALSPSAAMAQASAPAPSSAASTPRAAKPGPRALTATELRNEATQPGDLRPERAVTPQVRIPLGKTAPMRMKSETRAMRRGNATPAGGVDDAAARCEAQSGEHERANCRDRLTPHQAGSRPAD